MCTSGMLDYLEPLRHLPVYQRYFHYSVNHTVFVQDPKNHGYIRWCPTMSPKVMVCSYCGPEGFLILYTCENRCPLDQINPLGIEFTIFLIREKWTSIGAVDQINLQSIDFSTFLIREKWTAINIWNQKRKWRRRKQALNKTLEH